MSFDSNKSPGNDEYSYLFDPRDATDKTWAVWALEENSMLWEAAALHSSLEPASFRCGADSVTNVIYPKFARFTACLDAAVLHVKSGTLNAVKFADDPRNTIVQLAAYARWAQSLRSELPHQFPISPLRAARDANQRWGSHRTEKLDDLMAALNQFWRPIEEGGTYDRSDPATAPKSIVVKEWLQRERKLSKKVSDVMATILRADKLPNGPRVRSKKRGE